MASTTKSHDKSPGQGRLRRRVPAPDRLRGLAHPVRVRVLSALRTAGPSTATALANRLGLNSGATSYHLRQLAAYGFIEEANDLGNRRDRFWKVPEGTTVPSALPTTGKAPKASVGDVDARAAFLQARLVEHHDAAQAAVEGHPELDEGWSAASDMSTHIVTLDHTQAAKLMHDISALIEAAEKQAGGAAGSNGNGADSQARPFVVQVQGFLAPAQPEN